MNVVLILEFLNICDFCVVVVGIIIIIIIILLLLLLNALMIY